MEIREMRGSRIREMRKAQKMTQAELAKLLGVSRVTISKYETGEIEPPTTKLLAIAKQLGCSVYWLLGVNESLLHPSERNQATKAVESTIIERSLLELEEELGLLRETLAYPLFDGRYNYYDYLEFQEIWNKLNEDGRNEGWNRLEELTHIPRYQASPSEDQAVTRDQE